MLNDVFLEQTLCRTAAKKYLFFYLLAWVAMIVCGFYAAVSLFNIIEVDVEGVLSFNFIALLIMLVAGALAVLIYRKKDDIQIEYDYSYVNGILDVAKVMNRRRRKYMMELDMKIVTESGRVSNPRYEQLSKRTDLKKFDFSLNPGAEKTYFYFQKNGIWYLVVTEINEEIRKAMCERNVLPYGAWIG